MAAAPATAPFSLKELEDDPRLFLYTSLTAGSSHIITATSRMETILKANRIPFQAIDIATDEKARRLWQRRAGGRKLPGLVKEGFVLGALEEVEEWNEFGELKEAIGPVPANNNAAGKAGGSVGVNIAPPSLPVIPTATGGSATIKQAGVNQVPKPFDSSNAIKLPGAEEIAAKHKEIAAEKEKARAAASITSTVPEKTTAASATSTSDTIPAVSTLEAINPETLTSSPEDKKESIEKAKEAAKEKEEEVKKPEPSETIAASISEETAPVTTEEKQVEKPVEPVKEHEASKEAAETVKESEASKEEAEPVKKHETPKEETTTSAQQSSEKSATEEKATDAASKGISDLSVSETKTQDQNPKEAEDAAKSVED